MRRVEESSFISYFSFGFFYSKRCASLWNFHFCFPLCVLLSILSAPFFFFPVHSCSLSSRKSFVGISRLWLNFFFFRMSKCNCVCVWLVRIVGIILFLFLYLLPRSFVRNHCPHWRSTSVDPNALEERRPEQVSSGLETWGQDEQAARGELRRTHESSHNSSYCRRCIRWIMSRQSLNTRLMFSVSTAHVKCG